MRQKTWYIILVIIIGITCLLVGYYLGIQTATNFFIKIAFALIDHNKINIDIDEGFLAKGIWQYKNEISNCLFMEDKNASILYK